MPDRWGVALDPIGKNDILFRLDRWRLISSRVWDLIGDGHRHLNAAVLEHLTTRARVTACSVHLPSSGVGKAKQDRARRELAKVVGGFDGPVILLADLNTEGESTGSARGLLRAQGFEFIRQLVDVENVRQPSHWNFGKNGLDDGWIDDIAVRDATVTTARLKTMHHLSDHNALLCRAQF